MQGIPVCTTAMRISECWVFSCTAGNCDSVPDQIFKLSLIA
ncbi:hypothetical protein ASZ90_016493 [hydrocarbon metagenome]|uniref:Uncharacterized protein n=1 Tax=hydrocarbon metagenome TaxID=938273 RepID=A0A0W8ER98_9ZZZZ